MRFLMWLLPWRDITRDGDLYMRRFYIVRTRWFSLFLHCIFRSDVDADLHDHPWSFIAMLLTGCYYEYDELGCHKIYPFSPRFRHAEYLHRLHLDKPVWTLFAHGPRRREWGFQTDTGWVHWEKYCDKRREVMNG